MRRILAMLVLLLACGGTAAQAGIAVAGGRVIECSAPGAPPGLGTGFMTMETLADLLRSPPPELRLRHAYAEPRAVPTLRLDVFRPEGFAGWQAAWFEAVAHPAGLPPEAARLIRARVLPPRPEETVTQVTAEFPDLAGGFWPGSWDVHLLVCSDPDWFPDSPRANTRELRAHARTTLYVSNAQVSTLAALATVLGLYLLLGLAAGEAHRGQYARARDLGRIGRMPRIGFVLQPPVIMQDRRGRFSLARFQGLLFTAVFIGVCAYALVRTGEFPALGDTTIYLLGAVLVGSLGAAVTEPAPAPGPQDAPPHLPHWRDLVADEGGIDLTRVQALLASLVAATALVAGGTTGEAVVLVPETIVLLAGVSQAIFVGGRLLERSRAVPAAAPSPPPPARPAEPVQPGAAASRPMIFVSYRREDSAGWVGRLAADLSERFGADNVFQDLQSIGPGVDFLDAIEERLRQTDCVLAVIGPTWLTVPARGGGGRRIDEPDDFVRLEIALALRSQLRVIPVLVGGAAMPLAGQLPEDLRALARRNAAELSDRRWSYDFDQLASAIAARATPAARAGSGGTPDPAPRG
jgi:hypothetical protein